MSYGLTARTLILVVGWILMGVTQCWKADLRSHVAFKRVLVVIEGDLGCAAAIACHNNDAKVAIVSQNHDQELERTAKLMMGDNSCADSECDSVLSYEVPNFLEYTAVDAAVEDVVNTWGGVDILIHQADIKWKKITQSPNTMIMQQVLSRKTLSIHHFVQALMRRTPPQSIINIMTHNKRLTYPWNVFHDASSFALMGYTESLSNQLSATTQINSVTVDIDSPIRRALANLAGNEAYQNASQILSNGLQSLLESNWTGCNLCLDYMGAGDGANSTAIQPIALPSLTYLSPISGHEQKENDEL